MSNGDTARQIRILLLQHPEGSEIWHIAKAIGREYTNVAKRLHATFGCYVKSWNGQRQVWACVPPPENAPRPAYVRKPYVPYKPTQKRIAAPKPVRKAAPPPPPAYKPQKTVWMPVAPWPTGEQS